jgi:hypothetical protein
MSEKDTTRVQMEMPPRSMNRLAKLKDVTEATSYAEVIRNALRLYEDVILQVENGNEILLKDKQGNTKIYKIFA